MFVSRVCQISQITIRHMCQYVYHYICHKERLRGDATAERSSA
jgi:hypothetical protein